LPEDGAGAAPPPVAHPVVRVCPETGCRGLFVDEDTTTRLLGVPEPESGRLLRRLCAAATDPTVTYRHAWRPGDLVVWDNHAVLHRAEPREAGHGWRMHRTMVAASRHPYGPAAITQAWVVAG
jgi:taurine dioxygenase